MTQSSPVYYWDACLFYEWLGQEKTTQNRRARLKELLTENAEGKNRIVTSVITHIEVLPRKLLTKHNEAERLFQSEFDGIRLIDLEISRNVINRAREIRDYYYREGDPKTGETYKMMDAGDAIHLATATIYGVAEFHTRDNKSKGGKVPLIKLYELSKEIMICGRYPLNIVSPESDAPEFPFDDE